MKVKIVGLASNKTLFQNEVKNIDMTLDLLTFLRQINLPIASSCDGEGICNKCLISVNGKNVLSCQQKLSHYLEEEVTITITYL